MNYEINDFNFAVLDEQIQKDFIKKFNDLNSVLFEQFTFTSLIPWTKARAVAYGKWGQEIDLFIWNLQQENQKDQKRYQHEAFLVKVIYQNYNRNLDKFMKLIKDFNDSLANEGDQYNRVFYGFLESGVF